MRAEGALGQVITFYSYKGGTGRSMALANVACVLAKGQVGRGTGKVLMVDWDLEAPGLHRFFRGHLKSSSNPSPERESTLEDYRGLVDLLHDLDAATATLRVKDEEDEELIGKKLFEGINLQDYILETTVDSLYLMKAGRFDGEYSHSVRAFPWEELFKRVPWLFRSLAQHWTEHFQYVLIDSRTGLSDISGICTALLPEKLVVVFTPNRQSLVGAIDVIRGATKYRREWDDLRPLAVFPLPSRIEPSVSDLQRDWRYGNSEKQVPGYQPEFEKLFKEVYELSECDLEAYFKNVQIQQVPQYAYGEEIAVLVEGTSNRLSLTESYITFADYLINLDGPWQARAKAILAELFATKEPREAEGRIAELQRILGPNHPDVVASLNKLGEVYRGQGNLLAAERMYRQALAVMPSGQPEPLAALNTLLSLYREQGKYADAATLLQESLARFEKTLGVGHPTTAELLENLAALRRDLGDLLAAKEDYQRALGIYQKALGPDDPAVGRTLNSLASVLRALGKYGEAEPLYRQALGISEKALGPDHPDVATSLNNLAGLYDRQGRYDEAEALYRRALEIRAKALGQEHPDVANSLNNLAVLYVRQARYDEAEALYRQALDIRAKALGPEHPDVANSLNNLAVLYNRQGRYDEAEALYRRALGIREKALGQEHPSVANSLNSLAVLFNRQGRYDEAEALYRRALEIRAKALGQEHPSVANTLNNLAALCKAQGRYDEAEALYRRALGIRTKALGPQHPSVANILNNLALLYASRGRYDEAEPLYRQALGIREKALGLGHPNVAAVLMNYADLLKKTSRLPEAAQLEARARAIRKKLAEAPPTSGA